MQAACKDLNFDLTIYHANFGTPIIKEQVNEVLSGVNKPGVIVFKNLKNVAGSILNMAEKA